MKSKSARPIEGSETAEWQLRSDGQEFGPYTESLLREWASHGKLPKGAQVSKGGPWLSVKEFIHTVNRTQRSAPAPFQQETVTEPDEPRSPKDGDTSDSGLNPEPDPEKSPSAAPVRPVPQVASGDDEGTPARDRIVILGRSRSGKTIYLATLYHMLWKRARGLTAKALTGTVHKQLMAVTNELQQGRWPAATQGNTQIEMEVEYEGVKRLLVTLDFAGELFARAFVHDQQQAEEIKPLIRTIDQAAAVLLIVDPAVVAGQDHAAAVEDDFGLVQAVERIRNWPGGEDVPIVLVLSKADTHQALLDKHGGMVGFVRQFFPALSRTLIKVPIFQVSAVQSVQVRNRMTIPKADSVQINVEKPLVYCLDHMNRAQAKREQERNNELIRMESLRLEREEERQAKRDNFRVAMIVIAICVVGFALIGLIIYWKS